MLNIAETAELRVVSYIVCRLFEVEVPKNQPKMFSLNMWTVEQIRNTELLKANQCCGEDVFPPLTPIH